jgi:hypothetical protein
MKSAQLPTRRSWRSLFSRSRADDEYFYDSKLSAPRAFYGYQGLMSWSKSASGKDLFVLRYSRLYCSGLDCPFDGLSEWREIDVFLRDFGIEQRCFESSSPANATKYTVVYDFLDGGFETVGGTYICGPKGACIVGIKALRFLCFGLGLTQPRRFKGEASVPSRKDLELEILNQTSKQQKLSACD